MSDKLHEAAKKLCERLREIHDHPEYLAVWTCSQIHRGPYTGPNYAEELMALEKAVNLRKRKR